MSRSCYLKLEYHKDVISYIYSGCAALQFALLIRLRLRTNYVIRVMRIRDKGDRDKFK